MGRCPWPTEVVRGKTPQTKGVFFTRKGGHSIPPSSSPEIIDQGGDDGGLTRRWLLDTVCQMVGEVGDPRVQQGVPSLKFPD